MKVLLINPPVRETSPPIFPSGLAYIAQVLREKKHDVKVLDINGYRMHKARVLDILKQSSADAFLIGGLITVYKYAKWLAEEIKKYHPEKVIIAGNSLASCHPELILKKTKIDLLVLGEGEITIVELIDKISRGIVFNKLKKIKGIAYKSKNKVILTKPRKRINKLDNISFPAWDLFPLEIYTKTQIPLEEVECIKGKSMHVVSGRGCPYRCTYCYHIFNYINKLRSTNNVIKELKILKKRYDINIIYFSDDLFIVNRKWVMEFCDKLIESELNLNWVTTGRVNLVDLELLKKMKQAGCKVIQYGIESGSQRMLNIIQKGVTVEQASKAIKLARKAGISVSTSFMMGFPEETKEDLEKTIKFCIKNSMPLTAIFLVTPYPGTALYEQVKKMGLIKNEEEYISKLGDATELTINLTKWSDKELINLRNYVLSKSRKLYFKKHRIEQLKWYFKKINWFIIFVKKQGIKKTIEKITSKLMKK